MYVHSDCGAAVFWWCSAGIGVMDAWLAGPRLLPPFLLHFSAPAAVTARHTAAPQATSRTCAPTASAWRPPPWRRCGRRRRLSTGRSMWRRRRECTGPGARMRRWRVAAAARARVPVLVCGVVCVAVCVGGRGTAPRLPHCRLHTPPPPACCRRRTRPSAPPTRCLPPSSWLSRAWSAPLPSCTGGWRCRASAAARSARCAAPAAS